MNDINWREELLDSAKFNKKEENLLRHGAKSLALRCSVHTLEEVERV